MTPTDRDAALRELAPTGVLRVAVNIGNTATVVVKPDGTLAGPAPDLLDRLVAWTGAPVQIERFSTAASLISGPGDGRPWDVAFLAYDVARTDRFWFSAPYLHIEASVAVWRDSAIQSLEQLDAAGVRIGSSEGAAFDLELRRILRRAERIAFNSQPDSFEAFQSDRFDAVVGLRDTMERFFAGRPDVRYLPQPLSIVRHCMATWTDRLLSRDLLSEFAEAVLPEGRV